MKPGSYSFLVAVLILATVGGAGCGGSHDPNAATQITPPGDTADLQVLPALAGLDPVTTAVPRRTSNKQYPFLGTDAGLDSGGGNHAVPGTDALALDLAAGATAWAVYSFLMSGGEIPLTFRVRVCDEADAGAPTDPTLPYWVGVANYTAGTWEWYGGTTEYETVVILPAGQGSDYLSGADYVHFAVVGFCPAGTAAVDPAVISGYLETNGTGDNIAPEAFLEVTPAKGPPGQLISLDATGSTDSDGTISEYMWDLDGDGNFNEAGQEQTAHNQATVNYTLNSPGQWNISVLVFDDGGASAAFAVEVTCTGWLIYDFAVSGSTTPWAYSLASIDFNPAVTYKLEDQFYYAIAATPLATSPDDWVQVVVADGSDSLPSENAPLAVINDNPAIAWGQTDQEENLMYSHSSTTRGDDAADWTTVTVDDTGSWVGYTCGLAEVDGYPAISYDDGGNTMLRYAIATDPAGAGSWSIVFVDNHDSSGMQSSLAVGFDEPHILHRRSDEGGDNARLSLMHATTVDGRLPGDWSELFEFSDPTYPIYPGNLIPVGTTLAFTFAQEFTTPGYYEIEYRYLDPDTKIVTGSSLGAYALRGHTPLVTMLDTGPGVLFFGEGDNLFFATNAAVDGSAPWVPEIVDDVPFSANYVSIALAYINGHVCAFYNAYDDLKLRYAVRFD